MTIFTTNGPRGRFDLLEGPLALEEQMSLMEENHNLEKENHYLDTQIGKHQLLEIELESLCL